MLSSSTTSFLSSILTKIFPLPSAAANSGLPPNGIVPATLAGGGVKGCGVIAFAVECKDIFGGGVINNAVRIFSRLDLAQDFKSFKVENRRSVRASVACEAAAKFRRDCDPVHSLGVRDVACKLIRVDIEHHNMRPPRDIQPSGAGVHFQVIEPSFTAYLNSFDYVITRPGSIGRSADKKAEEK